MRVAVVGTGFGRNHARVYSQMSDVQLVAVCDTNEACGAPVARDCDAEFVRDYRDLLGNVEAVTVAVPTPLHRDIACAFLERDVHVLLEKPIASTLEDADAIVRAAQSSNSILQVGHIVRFDPAMAAARRHLSTPSYFEIHRLSLFDDRSANQDVIVDLMIHDIDTVMSFVDSPIVELAAAGEVIATQTIDIANARLRFANGCVANLTAGRVYKKKVRRFRCYQEGIYVSVDYERRKASLARINPMCPGELREESLSVQDAEPLQVELRAFVNSIRGEEPVVTGSEAREALDVALRVAEEVRR